MELNPNDALSQDYIGVVLGESGAVQAAIPEFEKAIKIDPTKKPKTIEFTFTEGQLQGKTSLGIYELQGDTFKYCRAAPDKPRPTEFSSKEGSEQTLVVYKREKGE